MKFVDEASITVQAGRGGDGCLSFRREKFIAEGGPDGGDGGRGGSIYLQAQTGLTTLADFRVQRKFKAATGGNGAGRNRTGASGEDVYIRVPVGTVVRDMDTGEILGDLGTSDEPLLVAKGGRGGVGNTRFKSSTNRTPRQFTPGQAGESRNLGLELRLLADVGLLGAPNAGKSTLIRCLSSARPKVADYPFTTLYPQLGVVRVGHSQSFVVADIPGLIEGAAEGAGLGIRFLKHLSRTGLLLHLVDVLPPEGSEDPILQGKAIIAELGKYSDDLLERPRWLVLNKLDLIPQHERQDCIAKIATALGFGGADKPVFGISALSGEGVDDLAQAIMRFLEAAESAANEA